MSHDIPLVCALGNETRSLLCAQTPQGAQYCGRIIPSSNSDDLPAGLVTKLAYGGPGEDGARSSRGFTHSSGVKVWSLFQPSNGHNSGGDAYPIPTAANHVWTHEETSPDGRVKPIFPSLSLDEMMGIFFGREGGAGHTDRPSHRFTAVTSSQICSHCTGRLI